MYNQPEVALEKYELTVSRIIKGRGAYICDTGIGQKLLVPYRGHEQRACTLRDTLAFIQRNGMDVEQISQTKEQCIISRDNCEDAYILKDYRAGRECSTDSIDDMRGGSRALAQLHNILEKYPLPSDIEVESLHGKAQRKCAQIVKLKNYILRRSKTNAFEHLFYECYERFLEQGKKSAEILCELENSKTLVPTYCHGASTSTMSCIHSPEDGSLSISRPCIRDIRKLILRSICARCSKKITGIQRLQMQFLTAIAA